MTDIRVTFENIVVHQNGDAQKKGEVYYLMQVDGQTVAERTRTNFRKTVDNETIALNASRQVTKTAGQTLTVFGSVSEKDGTSGDESDSFRLELTESDNWGAGAGSRRLTDRKLDATVNYRIDLL